MQKVVNQFKVRTGPHGGYVPIDPKDTLVVMNRDGQDVKFSAIAVLQQAGLKKNDHDVWAVELSTLDSADKAKNTMSFEYTTGSAFRALLKGWADKDVPVIPSANQILQSITSSVSVGRDMPHSDEEALKYLQEELGYEKADEAYRIMHSIRKEYDDVMKLISPNGITIDDFIEWGQELEALEMEKFRSTKGAGDYRIELPVIGEKTENQYRGSIHISLKNEGKALSVDGVEMENFRSLSITGSVSMKEPGHRWKADSSGQCLDTIKELWVSYPDIVSICDIWQKWHLNNMQAGSRAQTAYLDGIQTAIGQQLSFEDAEDKLEQAGLSPDMTFSEKGYRYGSKWLSEELPPEVEETISAIAEKSFEGTIRPTETTLVM